MEITKEMLELAASKANHAQIKVMYDAMKAERDALAAQVDGLTAKIDRMQTFIKLAARKWEGSSEVEPTFWNLLRVANETPQHHLRELRAEAVLRFAGHVLAQYRYDVTSWASQYADSIRQGGAE